MIECNRISYAPGTSYPDIFLDNKYAKVYFKLVHYRLLTPATDGHIEKHHIIPKSLNGANCGLNIVSLSIREHLFCHKILLKMMTSKKGYHKMCRAALFMYGKFKCSTNTKFTAVLIASLKCTAREMLIERNQTTNRDPEKIRKTAEFHRGRKRLESTRAKISDKLKRSIEKRGHGYSKNSKSYYNPLNPNETKLCFTDDDIPKGWVLGNPKIKGLVSYFDPATNVTKRFVAGSQPNTWVKGSPATRNKSHYFNVHTGKRARFQPGTEPEGWSKVLPKPKIEKQSRRKITYFNPLNFKDTLVCLEGLGPEGWISYKEKNLKQLDTYYDPNDYSRNGVYSPYTAPDGWVIIKSNKGSKKYINTVTGESKRFGIHDAVPANWKMWSWAANSDKSKWKAA
jgi:hypothetical protein